MREMLVLVALLGGGLLAGCASEPDQSLPGLPRETATPPTVAGAESGEGASGPTAVNAVGVSLADSTLMVSTPSAAAGTFSFQIHNRGSIPHALAVRGPQEGWDSGPIEPGDSLTMSIALLAGDYELLCPLSNGGVHAQRGQRATLHVQ